MDPCSIHLTTTNDHPLCDMQFYPTKNTKTLKDFLDRFWSYVLIPQQASDEDCWEWVGHKNKKGYGVIRLGGFLESVHRVAYRFYCGDLIERLQVMHTCDCPPCVNPSHLVQGTNVSNQLDSFKKGRSVAARFLKDKNFHPRLKIRTEEYANIHRLRTEGLTLQKIGTIYNVSLQTIWEILNHAPTSS